MTRHDAVNPAAGKYYDHEPEYQKRLAQGSTDWEEVFDRSELDIFIEQELLLRGDVVLDLGTGGGQSAVAAARLGCRVQACDSSPTAIAMARQNARAEPAGVQERIDWICADVLTNPSWDAAPFDVVLDIHLFHGMVTPQHRGLFLQLTRSWLKTGGLLLSANMCGLPNTKALLETVDVARRVSRNRTRYFAEEDESRAALSDARLDVVYWNRRRDPDDVDYLLFAARRGD